MLLDCWPRIRFLVASIMLAALVAFVVQGGISTEIANANGSARGIAMWHMHVHDGTEHVHVHDVDPAAPDHDHDGKMPCQIVIGFATLPALANVVRLRLILGSPLVGIAPLLAPDPDPGGPRRPPRIHFIA